MNLTDAAAFIEGLPNHNSSRDVGAAFANWISPRGYLAVSCGESREIPTGRTWEFFFNTWPIEWLLQYQKNDYVRHDLAPTIARLTAHPFTWREAMQGKEQSQAQIDFNKWVASLGVVDALAVPIHYPGARPWALRQRGGSSHRRSQRAIGAAHRVTIRPSAMSRAWRPYRGEFRKGPVDPSRIRVPAMGTAG